MRDLFYVTAVQNDPGAENVIASKLYLERLDAFGQTARFTKDDMRAMPFDDREDAVEIAVHIMNNTEDLFVSIESLDVDYD